jgi:hypothetical protein
MHLNRLGLLCHNPLLANFSCVSLITCLRVDASKLATIECVLP